MENLIENLFQNFWQALRRAGQKVAWFSPLSYGRQPGPAGEKCREVLTAFLGFKVQIIESLIP
jgi:hypothetical protein